MYTTAESSAVCTTSAGGSSANFPGVESATLTGTDVPALHPVTVTAGADQLAAATMGSSGVKASSSGVATQTANSAPTAGVGLGLAGLAAVAMAM